MLLRLYFLIFINFLFVHFSWCQKSKSLDSINYLIEYSKDQNNTLDSRFEAALKSSLLAKSTNNDSIILSSNRNLSLMYFYKEDYDSYVRLNKRNLILASKLEDSVAITVAASNLGSYYKYFQANDSSYYYYSQALKFYRPNEISKEKASALLDISEVQKIEKIYSGAEQDAVKAILILLKLPETEEILDMLWSAYNLLGIVSRELRNYEKSIEYYDKSIEYAKKMDDGSINEIYSINNKAYVYRTIGDYRTSLKLYQSLLPLKHVYEGFDPSFYSIVIGNIADTYFESGDYESEKVQNMLYQAYNLGADLEDNVTIMNISIDLAKFYMSEQKNDSVYKYASKAYQIANEFSINDIKLEALMQLAEITDGKEAKQYLKEHIKLKDSLSDAQRSIRNKYARVKFDTDQLEAENEQISKENFYLLILSAGLLLTAVLVYLVISQRAKNRKLKLIQVQQKANEDIYNLMLSQQDKVDEARTLEKKRISEELHDGVLGRLFGTRLSLDSMNFKDGKDAMMTRANYIDQLKTIEEDIRKISHELNTDFVSGSGFMDIVSELIENQTKAYGLTYEFNYTDDISWDFVSNKTKINIYRIIQESMQNIYKHANAKTIKISISLEKDVICLDIIDDGEGFDTSKSKKGIGLKNMTSRVEEINGKITFTSQSGNGTTVNVKIPYNNQSRHDMSQHKTL